MIINRSRRRQKNSDWQAEGTIQSILNKPSLFSGDYNDLINAPSTFSGSYNDLTDKPVIPSYQSGTFVPGIQLTTSGSATLSGTLQTLRFIKIEKLVFITGALSIASVSSPVGDLRITGLPYTAGATYDYMAGSGLYINQLTNVDIRPFYCRVTHNTSYIQVGTYNKEGENSGAGYITTIGQYLQASTNMAFSLFYITT